MKGPIFLAILLVPIWFAVTASETCQIFYPPDCKTQLVSPSYFPHETICELYYRCDHGNEAIFSCPLGQMFDAYERTCELNENVVCNRCKNKHFSDTGGGENIFDDFEGEEISILDKSRNSKNEIQVPMIEECPETPTCSVSEVGIMKPYPPDCTKYLYCNDLGESILSSCPDNSHFSPNLGYCTSPTVAQCTFCEIPTTTTPILTTIQICSETPTCSIAEVGTMKPYPPDCTLYIYCNAFGQSILSTCSNGLHFSPHLGYCTLPSTAECPYCEEPRSTTIPACPNEPICGPEDSGSMLPYPPDCRRYIYCSAPNSPQIRVCYKDWLFDHTLLHCDIASNVFCPACTTEEPISTTELITTIATCPDTPKCTVNDFGALKPYPPDCSKYIYCDEMGIENIRICPFELHFSSVLFHCTNIVEANCPYCENQVENEDSLFLTLKSANIKTKPHLNIKTNEFGNNCEEVPECTIDDIGALLPYPPNCTYFIYCDENTNGILSKCPNNTHFSPQELFCMDPQQAQCSDCIQTTTTIIASTTIGVCEEVPTCSVEDMGKIKPYPPDCNMYVYCDENANEILSKCPFELHFSPTLLYCTTPEEANCPACEILTTTMSPPPSTIATCDETPTCGISDIGLNKPFPPDCTMYIYCDEFGNEVYSKCPRDFHFSPLHLYCMLPDEADCAQCEVPVSSTNAPSTTEIMTTIGICPEVPTCTILEFGEVKPYPPDCSMYIYCDDNGDSIISKCSTDLHFSPTELYCIAPEEANCPSCMEVSTSTTDMQTTVQICADTPSCSINEEGEVKPYPSDCSLYIYCDNNGEALLSNCPSGQHFSPILLSCTTPEEAQCPQCEVQSTTISPTTTSELISTTLSVCPPTPSCEGASAGTLLPYPLDCNFYIVCDDTEAALIESCPNGEHFSPETLSCTSPEEANCPLCGLEEFTSETTLIDTTELSTVSTLFPSSTTAFVCPSIPKCLANETGAMKPYPPDCNFYIYCNGSIDGQIRKCARDLQFDKDTSKCIDPLLSTCIACDPESSTTFVPETSSIFSTSGETSTLPACAEMPTCGVFEDGVKKPYPPDCTKYFLCSLGTASLTSCPLGEHFSPTLFTCAAPELADCPLCTEIISSTLSTIESTTPEITTLESTTNPSSLPPCAETPTCTVFENGVKKPYPIDCTKYIFCSIGSPIVQSCPPEEHFSPTDFNCMNSTLANCPLCSEVITSTLDPSSSTAEPTTQYTTEEETTSRESSTEQASTLPSSTLPPCVATPTCTVFENGVMKPYPPDCEKYVLCSVGSPILKSCPPGQHFSPTKYKCEDALTANCPLCAETEPTSTVTVPITTESETPTVETTITEEPTSTTPPLPYCPPTPTCTVLENGVNKPYPPDCEFYVYCAFGSPEIRKCKAGFEFSPISFKCVDAALSNCPRCSALPTTVTAIP